MIRVREKPRARCKLAQSRDYRIVRYYEGGTNYQYFVSGLGWCLMDNPQTMPRSIEALLLRALTKESNDAK